MFKRLKKNRLWLITVIILLALIGAIAIINSKDEKTKEHHKTEDKIEYGEDVTVEKDTPGLDVSDDDGAKHNKIEYGEDVTVEKDTPGLDVSDDDGAKQNSVRVPGTWEENSGNAYSNSAEAGNSNTGKTDSDTQNTESNNSEQGTEQNILEDDKSWGTIF